MQGIPIDSQYCKECRFWGESFERWRFEGDEGEPSWAYCQRFPPTILEDDEENIFIGGNQTENGVQLYNYPYTHAQQKCGEWRAKSKERGRNSPQLPHKE